MMMAVYGGVAMAGQAVKRPSDMTAMIIRVFIVILVYQSHFSMLVNGRKWEKWLNPARFLALPLDVVACL
jgi:hypothetical protein